MGAPPKDCAISKPTLRVLQVISSISVVNGGASTAMWSTLDALRLRNVDVDLVTTNEDGLYRLMEVPTGRFIREREHRVRYFPAKGDRYTTSWPLAAWLLRHVRDYDVIHIHGLFRFPPVAAAHAAILRNVPYVMTLHNTLGDWGMRHRKLLLKKLSMKLLEDRMLSHARRVHLCSANELKEARETGSIGERSRVFPLGIELPTPQNDAAPELQSPYSAYAGRKVVLFMSRIHEVKGLDKLIRAFALVHQAHPDAVLVIAGTGDEPLVGQLRELASQVGIAAATDWIGFVQGPQKDQLLAAAGVFVLPSLSENFGYVVIEAMLAGLPVVTSENVPAGQFAVDAGAGVIFGNTTEELARNIERMLALSAGEREQLAARAQRSVREHLSLDTFGRELEALYREACERNVE